MLAKISATTSPFGFAPCGPPWWKRTLTAPVPQLRDRDPADYDAALRRKGCMPMDFTGRPMVGFVFINPPGLATDGELSDWLKLALEFNPRAKSSKKKSAPPSAD